VWRAHATTTTLRKRGSARHGARSLIRRERGAKCMVRALRTPSNTSKFGPGPVFLSKCCTNQRTVLTEVPPKSTRYKTDIRLMREFVVLKLTK
jgi:hypothetical protein